MRGVASIRTKLLGLLAVPLAALAVVAALGVAWSEGAADRSRDSVTRTETALVSVRAALELSRERGLSAGTLAAPAATDLRRELEFQRGQSDVALDDLAPGVRLGGRTAADVAAGLAELRRSVDRADTAVGDVLATYGERVDALLGLYVVGRLAERHGIEVALAPSPLGGLTAHVVLPARQITSADDAGGAPPVIQRVNAVLPPSGPLGSIAERTPPPAIRGTGCS
jgi:hypothetical protein